MTFINFVYFINIPLFNIFSMWIWSKNQPFTCLLYTSTKDIHGSHVILRTNGQTPKISTIEKVASLAAYYSKARFSSHVPVDYTQVKYVKKPNGSVPGYVIYTNNKTIHVHHQAY